MISIRNLCFAYPVSRRYRDYLRSPFRARELTAVLENVSFDIAPGERLAILGCNGAGKTTLLKLIGGLLYPRSGRVTLFGSDSQRQDATLRRRIGYVINEERSFYWRLTGVQNLEFFGALNELHGRGLKQRVLKLMNHVGLNGACNKRVSDYSAGMRQRLALARGLLTDPQILLLDEPTKSLDLIGAQAIRELILRAADGAEQRTIVTTTNQMEDVAVLCDRLCVVHDRTVSDALTVPRDSKQVGKLVTDLLEPKPGGRDECLDDSPPATSIR